MSGSQQQRNATVKKHLARLLDDDLPSPALVAAIAGDFEPSEEQQREIRRLRRRRRGALYSDLLFVVTHHYFPHEVAAKNWRAVVKHRKSITAKLGRDVGLAVAALDYFTNVQGELRGAALIGERPMEAVAEIALRDGLTGLFDHAAFIHKLEQELRRYERYGDAFSVALFDVDDFKQVNDTFGHPRGDDVLRKVAGVLLAVTRATDIAARYGGEEFAVLFPRTPLGAAEGLVERVRARIESLKLGRIHVTVSAGLAGCPQHGETKRALVRAADKALYGAKHDGKNRVAVA